MHDPQRQSAQGRLTVDPYMNGWLRDLEIAVRRFMNGSDVSTILQELWRQLEIGSEVAEALSKLGSLSREASDVLQAPPASPRVGA